MWAVRERAENNALCPGRIRRANSIVSRGKPAIGGLALQTREQIFRREKRRPSKSATAQKWLLSVIGLEVCGLYHGPEE